MAKSKNLKGLSDKDIFEIVSHEISEFQKLMKGHEKILKAIGEL